jgi:hypothetical protein
VILVVGHGGPVGVPEREPEIRRRVIGDIHVVPVASGQLEARSGTIGLSGSFAVGALHLSRSVALKAGLQCGWRIGSGVGGFSVGGDSQENGTE